MLAYIQLVGGWYAICAGVVLVSIPAFRLLPRRAAIAGFSVLSMLAVSPLIAPAGIVGILVPGGIVLWYGLMNGIEGINEIVSLFTWRSNLVSVAATGAITWVIATRFLFRKTRSPG